MRRLYLNLNISVVFCLLTLSSARGESKGTERFLLVGIRDFDGTLSTQIMSEDEYRTLSKEIQSDNQALQRAYSKVRKAWEEEQKKPQTGKKEGEHSKKQPFPLKKPAPKQLSCYGIFDSNEAAEKKKDEYDQKEAKRLERAKLDEEKMRSRMSAEKLTAYERGLEQQAELLEKVRKEIVNMKIEQEIGLSESKRKIKRIGEGLDKLKFR